MRLKLVDNFENKTFKMWPRGYEFENCWFLPSNCAPESLKKLPNGCRILELGCWEGASTCYWIEELKPREIVCVDTWAGSWEHDIQQANAAKNRFIRNTAAAIRETSSSTNIHMKEATTFEALPSLIAEGETFDFVFVDASHTTFHVLHDLVLALRLLKPGGVMGIDDYAWKLDHPEKLDIPKQGIDAFLACYSPFLNIDRKAYQVWVTITADFVSCQKVADAKEVSHTH